MIKGIVNIVKSGAAFLQTGVTPPGAPPELSNQLANENHLASKKFFMTLSAFILLGVFYVGSVTLLAGFKGSPEMVAAFTTIFTKTIEVFSLIMSVYLGVQGLVDLKYNSSSSVTQTGNVSLERTEDFEYKELVNKNIGNHKEDDYQLS